MQNLHRHSSYSNIFVPDSSVTNEDYAKRAVELGHKVISSVEHGWQGYYYECFELAQKYNLKFIFGTEAYWVKDRKKEYPEIDETTGTQKMNKDGSPRMSKDKSNCHILLLAKTEKGRQAINGILSTANEDGYYFKPRIDLELLMSLPPEDIVVTTACVAYWKYEDIDDITLALYDHFKDNFYLEIQYHNTEKQKEISMHTLELARRYGIEMIVGLDSHYVYPDQADERQYILEAKNIQYDDEDGWYMDYPDDQTIMERFLQQGIFNRDQIQRAMDNTDIVLEFDDYSVNNPVFSKDIKLPTLYPNLTQEERNTRYSKLISKLFLEYVKNNNITGDEYKRYYDGVKMEVQTVKDTGMADYFLIDYEIVKRAIEMGGVLTDTGRGCFTSDALALTLDGIKNINQVRVGDSVIDKDGTVKKVINTMEYDCNEEMVQLLYAYGPVTHHPMICTKDHKILVHRNEDNIWLPAQQITTSDYLCVPKIHFRNCAPNIIDLNQYNVFNYDYDEQYIYEYRPRISAIDIYNSNKVSKLVGRSSAWIKKLVNDTDNEIHYNQKYVDKLLEVSKCSTLDEYRRNFKEAHTIKINRFIANDEVLNTWIGMMYGDGWVSSKKDNVTVGFACSTYGHKQSINKSICLEMCKRFNVSESYVTHATKRVEQIVIRSRMIHEFVRRYMFVSNKNQQKQFNKQLFYQSVENLNAILHGMQLTDGSVGMENNRDSFDNSSTSIIGAYKILISATTNTTNSLCVRPGHTDSRGYNAQTSYKIRTIYNTDKHIRKNKRTISDENYLYLPVESIRILPKQPRKVYDIEVEGSHSYILGGIVVHNSSVGYFTNTLLGFSKVDRFQSPITLYPERFISKTRILETHSLPDIDMNWGTPEIAEQAQKEILGAEHAVPMIAFGTCKKKSAFKLYARSQNMDFELANTISSQIDKYDEAMKYADDDEKDDINIYDFIDEQYKEYIDKSQKYWGIIMDKKKAPCAYLLYSGNIREEIGLIKCKSESTGKEFITTVIDGAIAENYKFLKNDILTVSVVLLIDRIYNEIGIKHHTVNELRSLVKNDERTWSIYSNGYTIGVNQCEKPSSTKKMMKYQAKNETELSAWIAAIRPAFKSMYSKFEAREHFEYGIKAFDKLIQTEEMPNSWVLYQENSMSVLNYAGFPLDECYGIIKAIAKKHPEKVKPLKGRFIEGFKNKIIEDENVSEDKALEMSMTVWEIIENSCGYGFNSAHAYCMALDSLYCSYLKSHYPYEFYQTLLQFHSDRGEKDKVSALKHEMKIAFGINEGAYKFGNDNRRFVAKKEAHEIQPSLLSLKGFSQKCADDLYSLSQSEQFTDFVSLLKRLEKVKSVNKTKIEILIRLGYFSDFGSEKKLLRIKEIFEQWNDRVQIKTDDCPLSENLMSNIATHTEKQWKIINQEGFMNYLLGDIKDEKTSIKEKLETELEYLGYISYTDPNKNGHWIITDIDTKYSPKLTAYSLFNGTTETWKISKRDFGRDPIQKFDDLLVYKVEPRPKSIKTENGWDKDPTQTELWLVSYSKC